MKRNMHRFINDNATNNTNTTNKINNNNNNNTLAHFIKTQNRLNMKQKTNVTKYQKFQWQNYNISYHYLPNLLVFMAGLTGKKNNVYVS